MSAPRLDRNGRPLPHSAWKPGQVTNPKGRPPGFQRLIRAHVGPNGERLVELLMAIAEGELSITQTNHLGFPLKVEPSIRERLEAIRMLRDSGFGRPPLAVEVSGPAGAPVQIEARPNLAALSDGELGELESLLTKAAPALPDPNTIEGEIVEDVFTVHEPRTEPRPDAVDAPIEVLASYYDPE